jgi:hypothetical protein
MNILKITKFCFIPLCIIVLSLIPSHQSQAADWCKPSRQPIINIKTSTDNIRYDFTKSEDSLNKFDISTVNPYGDDVITDVGGLMKGGIKTQHRISFETMTNPRTREVCIWHDKIEVSLHIQPTIYIASEFPQGTCMHNAILEHEYKHITVDREIVNKYAKLIGDSVREDINRYRIFGPVPISQESATLEMVKKRIELIMTHYTNHMSAERKQRQQAVDTVEEYNRVNSMCGRNKKR